MIELLEVAVRYYSIGGRAMFKRKCLAIKMSKTFLLLKSKTRYRYSQISNKKWGLIKKFKKGGCLIDPNYSLPIKTYRKRYWMNLDNVIEIGRLEEMEDIIQKLKRVDKEKS